jgi:ribonuclease HI
MKKDEIIIYTDGSSLGNPGPGGWGSVLIINNEKVIELGGREKESTNNRMEMYAAIEAFRLVEKRKLISKNIIIHTDSSYLLNGITLWVYGWVKNNWKTKTGGEVLNKDLWEILYKVCSNLKSRSDIEWVKVSGHDGVHLNERCDEIATSFSANNTTILFTGSVLDYEKLFGVSLEDHKTTKTKKTKSTSPQAPQGLSLGKKKKAIKGAGYSYVSSVSGKIHVDKTWADCEKRVKGKSGAKYKKVFSKQEEQELIGLWSLKSLF